MSTVLPTLPAGLPRFAQWFAFALPWEGEAFENDPADPGGATKFGIDQGSHPGVNIRELTIDAAFAIYWADWLVSPASTMPWPIGWVYFDSEQNAGQTQTTRILQRALGLKDDGVIGSKTLAAIAAGRPLAIASKMLDERIVFYKNLAFTRRDLASFLPGWLNRCNDLRRALIA